MEQLKLMKSILTDSIQAEVTNLKECDYQELGAAIDMLKDLSEAIYYCTITEAMEKSDKDYASHNYNRMYYDDGYKGGSGRSDNRGDYRPSHMPGGSHSQEGSYPALRLDMRDAREGSSPMSRRSYMEAKEMHHDKAVKMKELENYVSELGKDLTEMIRDASPEEKQLLQKKLAALATKIDV